MTTYIDSSATAKLFLDEDGAEQVRLALDASLRVVSSRLTYVETASALAAARRAGRLNGDQHLQALAEFEAVWSAVDVIELNSDTAHAAAEAADTFGLGAGDAVQLASVRQLGVEGTVFVAWDGRLRSAALSSGIACFPPEI